MHKILYVEDSPDARRLVQRLLSDHYLVLEAEDGLTGIEVTRTEAPALILIDINIPHLDGYEVATKLKSLRPEMPIVALTADVSEGARQRALAAGCDGYIPKPIDPDQFPVQVEAFLKGRREVLEQRERRVYTRAYQQKLVDRLEEKVRELTIRNQIADIFLTIPDEEMYGKVLQVILEAMESKYGVFGYIDEDGNSVVPFITRDVWDQCQISGKDIVFPREMLSGIWGRAMIEKKTLYSNEPFRVPEGHIPMLRTMTVPIIHQEELIGAITVANKATDYDEKNQKLLETIAGSIAPILHARLERDIQERERKRAEEQIRAALQEKEVLLREIHHRVKNNLQVISSLLDLQSESIQDPQTLRIFQDSQNRIRSMALVHEKLYQSRDLARIDVAEYVQSVVDYLFAVYGGRMYAIASSVQIDDVSMGIDAAIPCGLIISELVSNALKYAFPPGGDRPAGERGEIRIELCSEDDNQFTLVVSDNGVGLPPDLDFQNPPSLGLQLVSILTRQLKGTIELDRSVGTAFKITFAEWKPSRRVGR